MRCLADGGQASQGEYTRSRNPAEMSALRPPGGAAGPRRENGGRDQAMKIKSHSESHIVELDDGSRWQIFPGDLDLTLDWKPETDLGVVPSDDEISSHMLVNGDSRVHVIAAGDSWPVKEVKSILKQG